MFTKHSSPGVSTHAGLVASDRLPNWGSLRPALREVLELGLAGNPMVSMPACGVLMTSQLNRTEVTDELCLRWLALSRD